jgi:hypothetical protein
MGFQDFATHFLDGALFQNMVHIDDLPLLGDAQVVFGHFVINCNLLTFLSHTNNTSFFFVYFGKFQ